MTNPVETYFACLADKDLQGMLDTLNEDIVFEAQGPAEVPIYGTYRGKKDGFPKFFETLRKTFKFKEFEIRQWGFSETHVFAHGYMSHVVRGTGKEFKSEWALVREVRDGRISSYTMFEDTAALKAAHGRS